MISIEGLENPERQRELDPNGSLKRAGINDNSIVCDIGAGTGAFTFPAAKISKGPVYALDVLDEMLDFIESKKKKLGIDNIVTRKVTSERLPIDDGECDIALMVTVLHDIDDKETMMSEVRRLLKKGGRLLIIEFYPEGTKERGPPASIRISEDFVEKIAARHGFDTLEKFRLSNDLYGMVFSKE